VAGFGDKWIGMWEEGEFRSGVTDKVKHAKMLKGE
jgi:hypothetical protein